MWVFREHRGSLNESMKTCKSFYNLQDLIRYAKEKTCNKCFIDDIYIYLYSLSDERINWNPVYIVCGIDEVIGFCTEKYHVK